MSDKPLTSVLASRTKGKLTISVIKETALCEISGEYEDAFFVGMESPEEAAREQFADEWQARAAFRSVCGQLGIDVPYEAPVAFFDDAAAPEPVTASSVFWTYFQELQPMRPATPQAREMLKQMIRDPNVRRFAGEILDLVPQTDNWIHAIIRVACKRIRAGQMAELAQNPRFGMF